MPALASAGLDAAGLDAAGLTPAELDDAYTRLCHTMTRIGEAQAPLFLGRLALLALIRIGDAAAAERLIDAAAKDLASDLAPVDDSAMPAATL